jgi:hypothetical protein
MSRRAILLGVVAAGAGGAAPARLSPAKFGTGLQALQRCAEEAVSRGVPMWIDRDHPFESTWRPPAGLMLRGDFDPRARLLFTGFGDGVEITGPIDIDGVIVAGGLGPMSNRAAAENFALVGFHGPTTGEALSGVRVGRIKVMGSRKAGLVAANLKRPIFDQIEVADIYSTGVVMAGIEAGRIGRINARNIGDLQKSGHRRGSAILMAAETKAVAGWYTPGVTVVRPISDLRIESIVAANTTDTAVYAQNDRGVGFKGLQIGSVDVQVAGKDGFKVRAALEHVRVGTVRARQVAGMGCVVEGSRDVVIQSVDVDGFGVDALGMILGRRVAFSGGDAAGESISNVPEGVYVANSADVRIETFQVRNGKASVKGAEGNGLRVINADRLSARGAVSHVEGSGARISGARDFDITVDAQSAAKGPVLFSEDKVGPSDGALTATSNGLDIRPRGIFRRR